MKYGRLEKTVYYQQPLLIKYQRRSNKVKGSWER